MKLDPTDKRLLEILQADSKTNIKEIADKLNLTKSPVYDRIKRLENAGLIDKYVAVLDVNKLENYMVVFCSVSLESQKLESIVAFKDAAMKIPEVIESYLMGGQNDFLLKVVVKNLEAYHKFSSGKLAALPNVSQIRSSFVLDEVKKSSVVPLF